MIDWEETERFPHRGKFMDFYGATCSIQTSSIATHECIWVGVETTHQGGKLMFGRMHLTREMAKELGAQLLKFGHTGEIGPK